MISLLRKLIAPSSRSGVVVDHEFSVDEFKAGINRALDDTSNAKIKRHFLKSIGRGNWSSIESALTLWEEEGNLIILKNPESADDDEACIEMLKYIDRSSPIPGFLNYQDETLTE